MRILITGGAGFIGSHLAERLVNRGDHVAIVDDLSTGSIHNIKALKTSNSFEYFIDSVTNERLMAELVDSADVIYHLAAAVGVKLIVESPTRTMETNIRGTEIVLELAAKKKKRVLITSTSEVYGKRDTVPFHEGNDLILGPPDKGRWSYACSKLIDEFLAIAYWKEKRVPTVVARMFNVVGPRQTGRYGMVVPSLIKQALAGDKMTVYGDGSQTRCFTHVADATQALIGLAEHAEANGSVYNIGSIEEISVLALAQRIKYLTGSRSEIVFIPYSQAYEEGFEDMMRRVPDLSKIKQLIGYAPSIGLDEILTDIIRHHRGEPNVVHTNGHGKFIEPALTAAAGR
ncbi:MAG TPA: GDP-mannose 4,6-dehydratase [Candidatus Angelobacter sp.]|jgi:UDP-glucose 4-epimerase|nr:GDP-mannose 4,6-dehydratase [Candidatus Angelobacter sp.]